MGNEINKKRRNEKALKKLGENIRHYRLLRKLTISELAFKCNTQDKTIYTYEHATVDMSITMLTIVAKALEVSILQLLEGVE
ncbi:helix-turn-helix transcriptional regulator [Pedobacter sp. MC2016-15]|uniref:helix-turn-helix domain-containing protein n=1 Tax=Pedobacter sp. MC2016-15 TaxID=2994473 RepID=UPI002245B8B7|nr:helix-turn-helix transcriptional regulator [Pedobacter sp. MC2016-15]MCX2479339.1 helix-turn-helix transcriptional regulator [Pedobacter sp. MC2016-15]